MNESLGQLFMIGVSGLELKTEEADFIRDQNIGGVILFAHNYESPAQVAELCNSIQKLRGEYPLFISVDHEGGRVQRFKKNFTHFPSLKKMGEVDSPKLVFEAHQIMGRQLKAVGVNLDFSPCCDILTNEINTVIGDRSFGTTPEIVEKNVSAAIRGLQTSGVLACGKHFPGHGGTTKDSHFDLPLVKTPIEMMEKREWIPFMKAAKSRLDFMMMAHLLVEEIDTEFPTSLSPKAYELLRTVLKFKKIIITDDMEMKAVTDKYSFEEAATLAIKAGADMVIYRSFEKSVLAFEAFKERVAKKVILHQQIEDKVNIINEVKKRTLKDFQPVYIPAILKSLHNDQDQVVLEQIAKN